MELWDQARGVIDVLRRRGHEAYLVGGCVRDILLDRDPKDFDIVTSATPSQVMEEFSDCEPIGAHFGVVQVRRGRHTFEVATYRTDGEYLDGRRPKDVTFSSREEDVKRRDFTINALLMDPETREIIDLVGGQRDLEDGVVRAVGEPLRRFQEDKLRMLRAIRFASRFGFEIEVNTLDAIRSFAQRIDAVSPERVVGEFHSMTSGLCGQVKAAMELLISTGLLGRITGANGFDPRTPDVVSRQADRHESGRSHGITWALLEVLGSFEANPEALRLSNDVRRDLEFLRSNRSLLMGGEMYSTLDRRRLLGLDDRRVDLALDFIWCLSSVLPKNLYFEMWIPELVAMKEAGIFETPRPILSGNDLIAMGLRPGHQFKDLLSGVDDAVLLGQVRTKEQALNWVCSETGSQAGHDGTK